MNGNLKAIVISIGLLGLCQVGLDVNCVSGQHVIKNPISIKTISPSEEDKPAKVVENDVFAGGTFKSGDTLDATISLHVENNTDETIYHQIQVYWVKDGVIDEIRFSAKFPLKPGAKLHIGGPESVKVLAADMTQTYEVRWNAQYCVGEIWSDEKSKITDIAGCQGRFIWNRQPVPLEKQVAQQPEIFEHADNWLQLGLPEIMDMIHFMRFNGAFKPGSKTDEAINSAGTVYGLQFRELSERLCAGKISVEDESIALAVAMKKQFEAMQAALEPEQLTNVIRHANERHLRATYIDDHPEDVAFLSHPKMVNVVELDDDQKEKLAKLNAIGAEFHSMASQELSNNLAKAIDDKEKNKFAIEYLQKLDEYNLSSFESMMGLLTDQQRNAYENHVGIKKPFPCVFKKK